MNLFNKHASRLLTLGLMAALICPSLNGSPAGADNSPVAPTPVEITQQEALDFFTNWYQNWDQAPAKTPQGDEAKDWLLAHVTEQVKMTFKMPVKKREDLALFLDFLRVTDTTSHHTMDPQVELVSPNQFRIQVAFTSSAPSRGPFNGVAIIQIALEPVTEQSPIRIASYSVQKLDPLP